MRLQVLARIAVLSAMAAVAMIFVKFPLPFLPPFLKYDPSEVFAILAGFSLGPVAGLLVVAFKLLMYMLVTGKVVLVSYLANFMAGGTLVFVSSLLYGAAFGRRHGWLALLLGAVAMAAVMIPANYLIFLPYQGIVGEKALNMAISGTTPFNLFKALLTGSLSLALYARLQTVLLTANPSVQPSAPHR